MIHLDHLGSHSEWVIFWLGYQIVFLPHYSQANIEMVTRYFARFLTEAIENCPPLRPF